jgi:hypothetical protein
MEQDARYNATAQILGIKILPQENLMKQLKTLLALVLFVSAVVTGTAHAALIARADGMVYDDVNNITWAADANLFKTQAASNPNLVNEIIASNGGVIHDTPNWLDTVANSGTHTLTTADFNTTTGQMTWWGAQAWANSLSLGGYTNWALPTTVPVVYVYNQTGSQMGNLFYTQLGGIENNSITTTHNDNYYLFSNVQSSEYWSSYEYAPNPQLAWYFYTVNGNQNSNVKNGQRYAWAVRSGDISPPVVVPPPVVAPPVVAPPITPIVSMDSGVAKPCVKADLTGRWTAVVNDTGSNSTEQCKIIVNSAGKLTSGSCKEIQKNASYTFRSGLATINSQCNISLTINFNNGVVSKSTGAISRYRDTIIGTHKNNLGNFGTFSAVKY